LCYRPKFRPVGNRRLGGLCVIVSRGMLFLPLVTLFSGISRYRRKETKHCTVYSLSTVLSFTAIEEDGKEEPQEKSSLQLDQVCKINCLFEEGLSQVCVGREERFLENIIKNTMTTLLAFLSLILLLLSGSFRFNLIIYS